MSKEPTIRVHNTRPSVINLPTHGRFRPRLLPGTNHVPKSYWDKIMQPVMSGTVEVPSPTKKALVDTGVLQLLRDEQPDMLPKEEPIMHEQQGTPVPAPESLLHLSELDAFALIADTEDADTLAKWGREAHTANKTDLVEAIASRLQGLGFVPSDD